MKPVDPCRDERKALGDGGLPEHTAEEWREIATELHRQAERARKAVSALSKQLVETGAEAAANYGLYMGAVDAIKRSRAYTFHQLLGYSEWLDQQCLIYEQHPDTLRTHEDLVGEYLGHKVCTKHDYGIDSPCTCGGT